MQRATAAAEARWIGALSILLALPYSFSAMAAVPTAAMPESTDAARSNSVVPQRWRSYALSSITPGFSWAPRVSGVLPQVTDEQPSSIPLSVALSGFGEQANSSLNLSVYRSVVDDRPRVLANQQLDVSSELPGVGLKRTVIAPSYVSQWGQGGNFGITAVLAYQRFASLGMGEAPLRDGASFWPVLPGESSYGAGVRLDVGNALSNRVRWSAAYQSRVNMDALNTLRGVYFDPGQFDIPSSASVGLSYALTRALSFDVGVQRVMYSDVTPYTSPALPRRFLALLGSGASPAFAWQDLNVYSAGWTMRSDALGSLELRYTTRQQPSPTSALLKNALDSDPADHTVALGYSLATGKRAGLNLQAIYSSAPYFLGVPSYRSTDRVTGNQIEYEAAWSLRF